ncbi:hypothetical protein BN946_scf184569.g25 [Trametes cinnabarina]|uniref:XPG-I domain-containing protein n=1 Tax=Pycnoporus cinnabarinus TaxID=5643 RepID=A0A060S7L0_PYCCI|nr:hypothetical protein BN946_scf184569.g25 [Trametes cinnabarina]
MVTAARGVFEVDRLSRLHRLTKSLRAWKTGEGSSETTEILLPLKDLMIKVKETGSAPSVLPFRSASPSPASDTLAADLPTRQLDSELPGRPVADSSVAKQPFKPEDMPDAGTTDASYDTTRTFVPKDIAELYVEYRQSVPQLMYLAQAYDRELAESPAVQEASTQEIEEARIDYGLSKSQHGLVVDEGKLWEQLVSSDNFQSVETAVGSLASSLEARSRVLSESYARRTNPPTSATYEQSREILQAMGIPCVEPSGPYEAEALAASIVLNGFADYVASEDTDVLIYDAPLVRNVATGAAPLVLISGSDVRTVLQLDRARYIDFALLLGTDFSQRIKNVGPTRALKFIREHGSIERVLEHERQYPPRIPIDEYLEQIALARSVFNTLPPIPHSSLLQQGIPDEQAVWAILDRFGLRRYLADDWDYTRTLSGNYFADNPSAA